MKIIRDKLVKFNDTVLSIGTFDGVHAGHAQILTELGRNRLKKGLITFTEPPRNFFGEKAERILTPEKKLEILKGFGLDTVLILKFNRKISEMKAEDFLDSITGRNLEIICGKDFKLGSDGKNASFIEEYLKKRLQKKRVLMVIEPLNINNEIVSSSKVRELLKKGRVKKAGNFLGRKYSIQGSFVRGRQFGRKIGYPTANFGRIKTIVPGMGVYITSLKIDDEFYRSLTNIGFAPTTGKNRLSVETYIINFKKNVYNKKAELFFIDKIRDEIKFTSTEELKEQISKDIKKEERYFKNMED